MRFCGRGSKLSTRPPASGCDAGKFIFCRPRTFFLGIPQSPAPRALIVKSAPDLPTGFRPRARVLSREYVRQHYGGNFDGLRQAHALTEVSLTSRARKNVSAS